MLSRYMHWLHTQWPAGTVEKLPEVGENGRTSIPGVRITGDLTGIPLLKFSSDSGARAVHDILKEPDFVRRRGASSGILDLAIIGGGVSGISAAIEAKRAGLCFKVFEATELFSTVSNFPKRKPIYTYPTGMTPAGGLQFQTDVKEALLGEMEAQRKEHGIEVVMARIARLEKKAGELLLMSGDQNTIARALRVIVAIGRSGNFRKLGCPGEELDKVTNRLYDPKDFSGKQVLVVGGGDSALETAIALGSCGAYVTLSYRKKAFSRPKPANTEKIEKLVKDPTAQVAVEEPVSDRVTTAATSEMRGALAPGFVRLALGTQVKEIREREAVLTDSEQKETTLANDAVFTMLGREAPLAFFRRSGLSIRGEWKRSTWLGFISFVAFMTFVYLWKSGGPLTEFFKARHWFPFNIPDFGVLSISLQQPSFYYSLLYCVCVAFFGVKRIQTRKTPYVKVQTLTLMAIQIIPLFLLPYFLLPWAGSAGWFDTGFGHTFADQLFPLTETYHGREYWRAFGFILAWPLFMWNVFTNEPLWCWLAISFIQTFVMIPLIVWRWGKGAYCGWICSCGALAETLGDTHRHKMPHGPKWNRANMTGQVILVAALLIFTFRVISWTWPESTFGMTISNLYYGALTQYYHWVDIFLAGIVGFGFYFWFSGRVWCRFACPLAALMHLYARFSRFRIFAEKSKCISCNVCTSVCHQGIDIMNFANKGLSMKDPECVRCSACVQQCPTGTLTFGRLGSKGESIFDKLAASPVKIQEEK
jgi:NosR/NirI family transcriptional regulator, nitrous oxide reductase regulator